MTLRIHISEHNDDLHNTTAKKNIANGVAGLDENFILNKSILFNPKIRMYKNHLGIIDSYLQKTENGTASIIEDNVNSEFDFNSPNINDFCYLKTNGVYSLSSKKIIININIKNLNTIYYTKGHIGIHNGTNTSPTNMVGWRLLNVYGNESIYPFCVKDGIVTEGNRNVLTEGYLTIIATNTKILFYINEILVDTISTNLPTISLPLSFQAIRKTGSISYSINIMEIIQQI